MREPGKSLKLNDETEVQRQARQARNRRKRGRKALADAAPVTQYKPRRRRARFLSLVRRGAGISKSRARSLGWSKNFGA